MRVESRRGGRRGVRELFKKTAWTKIAMWRSSHRYHGDATERAVKQRRRCGNDYIPQNLTAAEQGFRELVSFIASDIIQLQGTIVARDQLLQSEPVLVEKFLRATIKGFISSTANRGGAVSVLARNVKTTEELAARIYDLVRPAVAAEGLLTED